VVAEDHPRSLGAFTMTREASDIYARSDLMIVVGSRLRGNETQNNRMKLPPIVQIDADPAQAGRNYPVELFVSGDARLALEGLLERLPAALDSDAALLSDIAFARAQAEAGLRAGLGH
jgi:acetolactate synthase-1/2/3 large subunit